METLYPHGIVVLRVCVGVWGWGSKSLVTMKQLCDETSMKPLFSGHPEQFTLSVWSNTCKYETSSWVTKKEFVKQKDASSERWTKLLLLVRSPSRRVSRYVLPAVILVCGNPHFCPKVSYNRWADNYGADEDISLHLSELCVRLKLVLK